MLECGWAGSNTDKEIRRIAGTRIAGVNAKLTIMSWAVIRPGLCAFFYLGMLWQARAAQQDLAAEAQRAKQAMLSQHYSQAVDIYRRMARELPDEPGIQFNLALALHSMGQYRESMRTLESIRAAESGNARFWFLLGQDYLHLEQPGRAAEILERAAQLDPSDFPTSLELASALFESGQFSAAEERFEVLAGQHPESAQAWGGLSLTASRLGDTERAKDAMERLAAMPGSAEQHEMLARIYGQLRAPAEALRELRAAEKLSPGKSSVEAALARALITNRQFDEAIVVLTTKVPNLANSSGQLFDLGDALLQTGKIDQAIPKLKRAVELAPELLPAHAKLGEALLQAGLPDEAISHLALATPIDRDGSIYFQLAAAYRRLGKPELANKAMARRAELQKQATPAPN
jgi:tetratricopeptide (TPR) repeat protein